MDDESCITNFMQKQEVKQYEALVFMAHDFVDMLQIDNLEEGMPLFAESDLAKTSKSLCTSISILPDADMNMKEIKAELGKMVEVDLGKYCVTDTSLPQDYLCVPGGNGIDTDLPSWITCDFEKFKMTATFPQT